MVSSWNVEEREALITIWGTENFQSQMERVQRSITYILPILSVTFAWHELQALLSSDMPFHIFHVTAYGILQFNMYTR